MRVFGRRFNGGWLMLVALISSGSLVARAALAQFDVPYVPTPYVVVDRMLEMADVQPDDYLVDLGSGDGRIVVAAVQDYDVNRALGVDINPQRVAEAEVNAIRAEAWRTGRNSDRATCLKWIFPMPRY
jgi:methylase of polypeptide subunit release factors